MEAAQDLRSTSKDIDLSETKTADQPRSHTEHKVTRAERVRMSVAKNSLPPINRKPIEPSLPSTPETLRQKKNDITQPALTSTPKVPWKTKCACGSRGARGYLCCSFEQVIT
eukprot:m.104587 g.104587  ORF g.104587 m.104587 type:complete len:112 (-) comp13847_c0_seq3:1492-1827(-)